MYGYRTHLSAKDLRVNEIFSNFSVVHKTSMVSVSQINFFFSIFFPLEVGS